MNRSIPLCLGWSAYLGASLTAPVLDVADVHPAPVAAPAVAVSTTASEAFNFYGHSQHGFVQFVGNPLGDEWIRRVEPPTIRTVEEQARVIYYPASRLVVTLS